MNQVKYFHCKWFTVGLFASKLFFANGERMGNAKWCFEFRLFRRKEDKR